MILVASNTSDIKTNIQNGINDWATQTQINNFNSTFRSSAFEKAVSLSDKSISDVSVQLSLLRYIKPITNQTNTYCIATGSELYDSNPSNTDGIVRKNLFCFQELSEQQIDLVLINSLRMMDLVT